jgi:hypothetical protein
MPEVVILQSLFWYDFWTVECRSKKRRQRIGKSKRYIQEEKERETWLFSRKADKMSSGV